MGGRKDRDSSVDRNWLNFTVRVAIDLVFMWVVGIDFIFVSGHRHYRHFGGDRNRLGFSVEIEIDLVLVRWVEIDVVLMCGPKMTWF